MTGASRTASLWVGCPGLWQWLRRPQLADRAASLLAHFNLQAQQWAPSTRSFVGSQWSLAMADLSPQCCWRRVDIRPWWFCRFRRFLGAWVGGMVATSFTSYGRCRNCSAAWTPICAAVAVSLVLLLRLAGCALPHSCSLLRVAWHADYFYLDFPAC